MRKNPFENRDDGGRFVKGRSGNPKGRPKGSTNLSVTVRDQVKPKRKNPNIRPPAPARPGPGRPRGSKNKNTLLLEQLRKAGPDLLKRLIGIAKQGDVPALKTVLAPLIAKATDNPVKWRFGKLESFEDVVAESERILKGIEEGELTPEQGIKLRQILDRHAEALREAGAGDRRSEFEREAIFLKLVNGDQKAFKAANYLVARVAWLERKALEEGTITAPVEHPLLDAAKAATSK